MKSIPAVSIVIGLCLLITANDYGKIMGENPIYGKMIGWGLFLIALLVLLNNRLKDREKEYNDAMKVEYPPLVHRDRD